MQDDFAHKHNTNTHWRQESKLAAVSQDDMQQLVINRLKLIGPWLMALRSLVHFSAEAEGEPLVVDLCVWRTDGRTVTDQLHFNLSLAKMRMSGRGCWTAGWSSRCLWCRNNSCWCCAVVALETVAASGIWVEQTGEWTSAPTTKRQSYSTLTNIQLDYTLESMPR